LRRHGCRNKSGMTEEGGCITVLLDVHVKGR
jgi:hypothetical protein